ncbi:hypothetical protein AVEN_170593-1 [Araneus ventricosus]|uniref:Uncharacterized protein n=1 Tax=Araneus ventricosus TaxID=182803 RepID=A0A4Y2VLJ7_ARAVE|nr:hypothetical protein AVEN_170593-1 [Araneus ventricosus]
MFTERREVYVLTQPYSILSDCKFAGDEITAKRVVRFSSNLAEMFLDGTENDVYVRGRGPKEKKKEHYAGFFPVSDKNTKDKRIVLRIMAKNPRYERVSAVAVAMMGKGKWSTKDYEILENIFIPINAGHIS